MCGICGTSGEHGREHVRAMNATQIHRGPDDEGSYVDPQGRMALGARRLSIIDLPGGHQPLSNEDGTVWAVLNGEIYNYPQLRARLSERGHELSSRTDTEVLVHLYEDHGADLVHALEGMYSFAIWDETKGTLLIGRDRFGEKPLFISCGEHDLHFASELTALLDAVPGTPALDLDSLDAFFVLGYVPSPSSIVAEIDQLPPGHTLTWDASERSYELRRYWAPVRLATPSKEPVAELAAETLRLLERSVARTLQSDVPVGVFLSGGVDSALIAALAGGPDRAPPSTFTVGYDVGRVSELEVAATTAAILGTKHHELVLRECDVEQRVPQLLAALDQPLADPALVPLDAVSRFARQHVTVAVGGEGADELFGGYPRYRWLVWASHVRTIVPERYASRGARVLGALPVEGRLRRLADVVAPQTTIERHLDWVTAHRRSARERLYGPAMRDFVDGQGAINSLRPHVPYSTGDLGADAFMQLDQRQWLPDDVLAKADRAGMLNSLEVRSPFLSRDIAEFANSIRADTHLGRSGKRLVRAALAERVPALEGTRPKVAFRVPGEHWLRGPLMGTLTDQAENGGLVAHGYFDRAALRATIAEHAAGADRTYVLWPVLALGLWYDAFATRTRGSRA